MTELPLIFAVDEDAEALERITDELQRYARDYRVICGPSTEAALGQLEALHEEGEAVAIVLAARGTGALKGEALLERVHDLHPHAKRALLIPWGGWADEETASAIKSAMALGHIDYYALKPWSSPDELFHRLISEFLQEWRRQNAPGRREITVVADPWSARAMRCGTSSPATACRTRFTLPDSDEGLEFLRSCAQEGVDVPVVVLPDGTPLVDPRPEELAQHGTGMRTEIDHSGSVRRGDRRCRPGRPRSRRVRLVRGARCARRRARVDRRTGWHEHADPQLPRLRARPERCRAGAARVPAGVGLRSHVSPHPRGEWARAQERRVHRRGLGWYEGRGAHGGPRDGRLVPPLDVPALADFDGVGVFYGSSPSEARQFTGGERVRRRRGELGRPGRGASRALREERHADVSQPRSSRACRATSSTRSRARATSRSWKAEVVDAAGGGRLER